MHPIVRRWAILVFVAAGCSDRRTANEAASQGRVTVAGRAGPRPDEPPTMVNTELPFRYPGALYARKVQGNVTLALFIDHNGRVQPESTRVEEASGYPSLDSAAVAGAPSLRFVPAKLHGEPIAVSILFPVFFRHPEASPLPGDTILRGPEAQRVKAP